MKYRGVEITLSDWIQIFAILLIVISGGLFSYYYIISEINDCTSSPLNYAAEKFLKEKSLEKNISYNYVELRIFQNEGDLIPIETIKINMKPNSYDLNKNLSL